MPPKILIAAPVIERLRYETFIDRSRKPRLRSISGIVASPRISRVLKIGSGSFTCVILKNNPKRAA